jgi:hypothetical protein
MTLDEVLALLQSECDKLGSRRQWALRIGVTPQYLSDVLNRNKEPGPKVLRALRLKRLPTTYERV